MDNNFNNNKGNQSSNNRGPNYFNMHNNTNNHKNRKKNQRNNENFNINKNSNNTNNANNSNNNANNSNRSINNNNFNNKQYQAGNSILPQNFIPSYVTNIPTPPTSNLNFCYAPGPENNMPFDHHQNQHNRRSPHKQPFKRYNNNNNKKKFTRSSSNSNISPTENNENLCRMVSSPSDPAINSNSYHYGDQIHFNSILNELKNSPKKLSAMAEESSQTKTMVSSTTSEDIESIQNEKKEEIIEAKSEVTHDTKAPTNNDQQSSAQDNELFNATLVNTSVVSTTAVFENSTIQGQIEPENNAILSADQSEISENQYFSANETNQVQTSSESSSVSSPSSVSSSSGSSSSYKQVFGSATSDSSSSLTKAPIDSFAATIITSSSSARSEGSSDSSLNSSSTSFQTNDESFTNNKTTQDKTLNNEPESTSVITTSTTTHVTITKEYYEEVVSNAANDAIESEADYKPINKEQNELKEIESKSSMVTSESSATVNESLVSNTSTKTITSNISDELELSAHVSIKSSASSSENDGRLTSMDIESVEKINISCDSCEAIKDEEEPSNVQQQNVEPSSSSEVNKETEQDTKETNVVSQQVEVQQDETALKSLVDNIVSDVICSAITENLAQENIVNQVNKTEIDTKNSQKKTPEDKNENENENEHYYDDDDDSKRKSISIKGMLVPESPNADIDAIKQLDDVLVHIDEELCKNEPLVNISMTNLTSPIIEPTETTTLNSQKNNNTNKTKDNKSSSSKQKVSTGSEVDCFGCQIL